MLATGEPAAADGGQNETNLPWLLRLRWGALAGQLLTIVFVRYVMRSPIPIGSLFGLLAISLLTSVAWQLRPAGLVIRSSWLGATMVLDTTRLSVHDLRRQVTAQFGPGAGRAPRLHTRLVSFGFKFGTPVDADLLFDVRFLDNPHFVPELRDLPGTTEAVKKFVLAQPDSSGFLERVASLLEFCLPRFEREGKSYLTVAIGCTGGRHRSVVITDELGAQLRQRVGGAIDVVHRDIDRVRMSGPGADPDHASPPLNLAGVKANE